MLSENIRVARCDECGRDMPKAQRRYLNRAYCAACYKRVFKPLACTSCGQVARLPKNIEGATCQPCQQKGACVRCGKEKFQLAKISAYGPVCPSCAHYFREPEPCESCGALSTLLSRVTRIGSNQRLCPVCAGADKETCSMCHRYRYCTMTESGPVCQKCDQEGMVPCPICTKPMPAGRGDKCETCYWENTAANRIVKNTAALSSETVAEAFRRFGEWMINEKGGQVTTHKINRYWEFFYEIELKGLDATEHPLLVKQFGTARLRKYALHSQWLASEGIDIDEDLKLRDSDERLIQKYLAELRPYPKAYAILHDYLFRLLLKEKAGDVTMRTVRFSMTAAVGLLKQAEYGSTVPQQALNDYLKNSPGQRASVSGFVTFLNEACGHDVVLPKARSLSVHEKREMLRKRMIKLIEKQELSQVEQVRWVMLGLCYFHDLSLKRAKTVMRDQEIANVTGGSEITSRGKTYFIPSINDDSASLITQAD